MLCIWKFCCRIYNLNLNLHFLKCNIQKSKDCLQKQSSFSYNKYEVFYMNQLMNCIHSVLEQLNNKYIIDEDTFKLANDSNLIPFLYLSMDDKTNEDI